MKTLKDDARKLLPITGLYLNGKEIYLLLSLLIVNTGLGFIVESGFPQRNPHVFTNGQGRRK